MKVVFDHAEEVAQSVKTLWFRPERPVRYIAGQFTEIHLPHEPADERGMRRWFTLSSSPTDPLISITTKFATSRASSFKRELARLKPGTTLHLADPMGDFVLPKNPQIPLLFVAAGLGITPVHSMIKWLLDSGERRQIHLIYAAAQLDELAFTPLFERYPLTFTPIIKRPPEGYRGQSGSITVERLLDLAPDDGRSLIYLSGPEAMTETFFRDLTARGISPDRLVTDYFPGYSSF